MKEPIHILAVDDEEDIREIVRILLEGKGYAVACAATGTEAVTYIADHPGTDLLDRKSVGRERV